MSTQTDQRLVLDLLETGKIDTSEADWLLDKIGKSIGYRPATPYQPAANNKVILEIDADEDNLQAVMQKLNEALCQHKTPQKKRSIFKRLSRGKLPKATIQ
jgi:hypothetical protein